MKRLLFTLATLIPILTSAQNYKIEFSSPSIITQQYYLGQHFRDTFILYDSVFGKDMKVVFAGSNKLETGVYTLLDKEKKKIFDFMVDDSRKFSIAFDDKHSNAGMKVTGSKANTLMFQYMAKLDWANEQGKAINERKKDPALKAAADKEMEQLAKTMKDYEEQYIKDNKQYRFTKLVSMSRRIDVPDAIPAGSKDTNLQHWQAIYYRTHFWDLVDLTDHSLIYTPQLFDKMNYYFFGLLYYQDSDTITRYAHMVLDRIVDDSTMLNYFLEFITPRYERSTKNIGWDQVFVNLVRDYYLAGHCPWATKGNLTNKRQTVEYLSHSLIGAMGIELLMADTNQSPDPKDWISSHAFPQKYVMLWFWDPDCSHCKRQTAELKTLYDSLSASGNKVFEVYAVGYESDTRKWIDYVEKHQLPFVNVGGPNVNVDYQEAYNVHGAPTMILLNADRQIIMNKTLPTKSVLPFIEQYEKDHPEQADRAPSQWQLEGIRRAKIK
ncbi:MAG: thioredoxin fold domain-containing protein [Bacteroidales bacterium]|nr:thioredoxin fold domain-containing protein [Bacteroidales bacterium]